MKYFVIAALFFGASVVAACSGRGTGLPATTSQAGSVVPVPLALQSPGTPWIVFTTDGNTTGIAAGPDNAMWFTEYRSGGTGAVGRIAMDGTMKTYTLRTGSEPFAITKGSDGNLWFADASGNAVGRITPSGAITEYRLPTANANPMFISSGPDGDLWLSEVGANQIARVSPGGKITEFALPRPNDSLGALAGAPDGNVWYTERFYVGRISHDGVVKQYALPPKSNAVGITGGADGNIWFANADFLAAYGVGKIDPHTGVVTTFALNTQGANGITKGPDGNLWFTTGLTNHIGYITPAGVVHDASFAVPFGNQDGPCIAAGPDGNLWFCDGNIGVYARLAIVASPSSLTFSAPGQHQTLTVREAHFSGTWTVTTQDPSIATVAPGSTRNEFVVTSVGSGGTTVTVADTKGNLVPVSVTVH